MKKINQIMVAAALATLGVSAAARADLVVSLENAADGSDTVALAPGGSFTLDVVVTGPDEFMSAIFDLSFASSGLVATDYLWSELEFETGGADEFSTLDMEGVPFTIDEALHFENLTGSGMTFDEGVLLSLTLMVPESFVTGPSQVTIMPSDFTLDGFEFIPTSAAGPFTINIAGSTGGGGGGSDPGMDDDGGSDNTNDNTNGNVNDNGADDGDMTGNDNGSGDDDGMSDDGVDDGDDDDNSNSGGGDVGNDNGNGNTAGEGGGAPGTMCAMGMINAMLLTLAGLCGLRSARRRLFSLVR